MTPAAQANRRGTRDAARTRQAILEAASTLIARDGTGASLAAIAAQAGVTKSGLMHHFASRDALFEALVTEAVASFHDSVNRRLDLSENHPGKLLRAYVHVLCDDAEAAPGEKRAFNKYEYSSISIALHGIPTAAAIISEDAYWWTRELAADGLPAETVFLVRLAADGLTAMSICSPSHARELAPQIRAQLVDLTTASSS
ncbi:TetR/AcrR family transcriptional regulator [Nakamurella silvestris]|nr:TetR/AcrR family transcriptional regulator [Nakamurella silvestris]